MQAEILYHSDTIRRLARTPRLSEIAGTKTVTKEQWLSVEAVFKKQEEKDLERRRKILERQSR